MPSRGVLCLTHCFRNKNQLKHWEIACENPRSSASLDKWENWTAVGPHLDLAVAGRLDSKEWLPLGKGQASSAYHCLVYRT